MDDGQYYGAPGDNDTKTLGERLRDYYDPEDFVTVQNIDIRPVTYQFIGPTDIETFSDYPGHKDTVMKKPPVRRTINPGETRLCPAYEADMLIEVLIKQMTNSKTHQEIEDGTAVNWQSSNWTDPALQKALIKQIFLGKQDVFAQYNKDHATKKSAEKDLDIHAGAKA